jgi:CRP/FNR family transcriptional regulator, dissimilatory nitrate respiration regulator
LSGQEEGVAMGTEMDKAAILSRIGLFDNISDENRDALAEICLPKQLRKNQTLFVEGARGLAVYILVTGSVQLYKSGPDGRKVVIKTVRSGEMFGEVILFEQNAYPVSSVALRDSLVYLVPKHQFLCLLEADAFRADFLGNLMRKLRYLADQIKYLTSHDVEDRLLAFLAEHHGRRDKIVVNLSKKNVAAAIGATPETLSRVLLRMAGQGLLTWKGSTMRVAPKAWSVLGPEPTGTRQVGDRKSVV